MFIILQIILMLENLISVVTLSFILEKFYFWYDSIVFLK
jgi:hypothetical protein